MPSPFSIFQPGFYEAAREGAVVPDFGEVPPNQWFLAAVATEFTAIAGQYGCRCRVSEHDAEAARVLWVRDAKRMDIDGDGTPDHFKQAGFLSYWLRRRMALREPRAIVNYDTAVGKHRQETFLQMAPEFASFIFGYNLCLFAESKAKSTDATPSDIVIRDIRAHSLSFEYLHDVCLMMRTKHLSPHAITMTYRSLFELTR